MVDSTSVAEEDREEDLLATWNRLFPPDRDYLAAAKEKLGPEPEGAGEFRISPFELMSMALPALFGSPEGSAAMYRGALGGHLQRGQLAGEAREKYAERAGKLAEQIEAREERRALGLLPYEREKATERERRRLAEARLAFDRDRTRWQQDLDKAKFSFEQFKHFNPSAAQQTASQIRLLEARTREAHNRAQDALGQGRLEEYKRHNRVAEDLTRQARDIQRQQVEIAWSNVRIAQEKAARGDPSDLIRVYTFLENEANDIRAKLGDVFYQGSDQERVQFEATLKTYEARLAQLRPQIERVLNAPTTSASPIGTGTAPPPGKTITRAELQAIAKAKGITEAEAQRVAEEQGYTVVP